MPRTYRLNGVDLEAAAMEAATILGEHPGRVVARYRAVKAAKGHKAKAKELARQVVRSGVELEKDNARILARAGGWDRAADALRKNPTSPLVAEAEMLVIDAYRKARQDLRKYGIPIDQNADLKHAITLLDQAKALQKRR